MFIEGTHIPCCENYSNDYGSVTMYVHFSPEVVQTIIGLSILNNGQLKQVTRVLQYLHGYICRGYLQILLFLKFTKGIRVLNQIYPRRIRDVKTYHN